MVVFSKFNKDKFDNYEKASYNKNIIFKILVYFLRKRLRNFFCI